MLAGFNPETIQNLEGARQAIVMLLNLVEDLKQENEQLREEVQRLRDEIQRLKGEQGKPNIPPNRPTQQGSTKNHSSEQERHEPKSRQKRDKVTNIRIDREEVCSVDRNLLPPDARFKGYETVVTQDIQIKTDNVRFLKEKFYSPSEKKTYLAELPQGYNGEFGPGIKSLAIALYHAANMTEPKILEFFHHMELQISDGQLSNLLVKDQETFHDEKDALSSFRFIPHPSFRFIPHFF